MQLRWDQRLTLVRLDVDLNRFVPSGHEQARRTERG